MATENRYGLKPGERLVCGHCGAFLPANISPETHGDWECRCGEDWYVTVKAFAPSRRRTQRLPLTAHADRPTAPRVPVHPTSASDVAGWCGPGRAGGPRQADGRVETGAAFCEGTMTTPAFDFTPEPHDIINGIADVGKHRGHHHGPPRANGLMASGRDRSGDATTGRPHRTPVARGGGGPVTAPALNLDALERLRVANRSTMADPRCVLADVVVSRDDLNVALSTLAAERQRAEQAERREARLRAALEYVRPYVAHFKGGWSTHTHGGYSTDEVLVRIDAALAEGQDG